MSSSKIINVDDLFMGDSEHDLADIGVPATRADTPARRTDSAISTPSNVWRGSVKPIIPERKHFLSYKVGDAVTPGIIPVTSVSSSNLAFSPSRPQTLAPTPPRVAPPVDKQMKENSTFGFEKTMVGPIGKLPSVVFNDSPMPEDVPSSLTTTLAPTGVDQKTPEPAKPTRMPKDAPHQVSKADVSKLARMNSSAQLVRPQPSEKPHDAERKEDVSPAARSRRMGRLVSTFAQHSGDVPLVMPLHLQLAALDSAVRTAVASAEHLGESRRQDDWDEGCVYKDYKVPDTIIPSLRDQERRRMNVMTDLRVASVDRDTSIKSARGDGGAGETRHDDVLRDSQRLLKRVLEKWAETNAELKAEGTQQQGMDVDVTSSTPSLQSFRSQASPPPRPLVPTPDPKAESRALQAAEDEEHRWRSLDSELSTSIDAIRKEMNVLETYQRQLNVSDTFSPFLPATPRTNVETSTETMGLDECRSERDKEDGVERLPSSAKVTRRGNEMYDRVPFKHIAMIDSPMPQRRRQRRDDLTAPTGSSSRVNVLRARLRAALLSDDIDECRSIQKRIRSLEHHVVKPPISSPTSERTPFRRTDIPLRFRTSRRGDQFASFDSDGIVGGNGERRISQQTHEESEFEAKISKLEARLAVAAGAEKFKECAEIQNEIDLLVARLEKSRVRFDKIRDRSEHLTNRMRRAATGEAYAECESLASKMNTMSLAHSHDESLSLPVDPKLTDLEAKLAVALTAEDYGLCASLQRRITPLRANRRSREQSFHRRHLQLETLRLELQQAIDAEDFSRCASIQSMINQHAASARTGH